MYFSKHELTDRLLLLFGFTQRGDLVSVIDETVPISSNALHLEPEPTGFPSEGGILMDGLKEAPSGKLPLIWAVIAALWAYPKAMKTCTH